VEGADATNRSCDACLDHSGLMPAAFTIGHHFSISAL
jgi:hypothetical protein